MDRHKQQQQRRGRKKKTKKLHEKQIRISSRRRRQGQQWPARHCVCVCLCDQSVPNEQALNCAPNYQTFTCTVERMNSTTLIKYCKWMHHYLVLLMMKIAFCFSNWSMGRTALCTPMRVINSKLIFGWATGLDFPNGFPLPPFSCVDRIAHHG